MKSNRQSICLKSRLSRFNPFSGLSRRLNRRIRNAEPTWDNDGETAVRPVRPDSPRRLRLRRRRSRARSVDSVLGSIKNEIWAFQDFYSFRLLTSLF